MRLTQAVDRAAVTRAEGLATRMGDRHQNWAEFRSRISRLAQGLVDQGVTPGDRVALLAPPDPPGRRAYRPAGGRGIKFTASGGKFWPLSLPGR